MDLKKYKEEAIALLGEYHKREAQIRLLEVEYQAMEQLTPGVCAVSYDQVNAHTNKIASPVEGLRMPQAVAAAVNEYKSEMDVVAIFLDECTERGPGDVRAAELYQVYKGWAKENGQYIMSSTKFGLEISKRFQKRKNGNGCIVYIGLRFIGEWKPYSLSFG